VNISSDTALQRALTLSAFLSEELQSVKHALRARRAARAFSAALEQKFNPNWAAQPRAPAGSPNGGEWTGGVGPGEQLVQRAPAPSMARPIRLEKDPRPHAPGRNVLQIENVLGSTTYALAAHSPSIQQTLKRLEADDREIHLIGDGLYPEGSGSAPANRRIFLDRAALRNSTEALRTLSHELGHAEAPPANSSSERSYLRSQLRQEGYATLMNIRVQREILASRGIDIGISTPNAVNVPRYQAIYDRYLQDGNKNAAADAIGAIYEFDEWKGTMRYGEYYQADYHARYRRATR
jgi:hypothetical protein